MQLEQLLIDVVVLSQKFNSVDFRLLVIARELAIALHDLQLAALSNGFLSVGLFGRANGTHLRIFGKPSQYKNLAPGPISAIASIKTALASPLFDEAA